MQIVTHIACLVLLLTFTASCSPNVSDTTDEPASGALNEGMGMQAYLIKDLPVYRSSESGSVFDPSILMSHIMCTVDPDSWVRSDGKGAEIFADVERFGVVVYQSSDNHVKVKQLIDSFRDKSTAAK